MLPSLCVLVSLVVPGQVPDQIAQDEKYLQKVGIKSDGVSLLDYFRKRTFQEADPAQLAKLIASLGDEEFVVREKAFQELLVLGPRALAAVKQAESHKDAEVRRRAQEIQQRVEAKADPSIQAAAVRVLGKHKPNGSTAVLLAFVPYADPYVHDDLAHSLAQTGVIKSKADDALIAALGDARPIKRALAAQAIVEGKCSDLPLFSKKMLGDPDPEVRLRVSLALTRQKNKEGLSTLVDLLEHFPPEKLWTAEELLIRLAGNDAPPVSLGGDPVSRKKTRDAWAGWLVSKQGELDQRLAKIDEREPYLGYTLMVQQQLNRVMVGAGGGRIIRPGGLVQEIDANKQVKWKFELTTQPVDAQVVGPDRVLVAEFNAQQVSERDFKGTQIWQVRTPHNPIGVQRLANGNTFVVMQNRLSEYDRTGKEVWNFARNNFDLFRGRKLKNGDVVFVSNTGTLTRIEAGTNKVLKTFQAGNVGSLFGAIDILPSGGYLVPDFSQSRVVEYDADGKQLRQFGMPNPNSAMRLPNGNTLVASQNQRRIAEFDGNGREVWSHTSDGMVFVARRR